MTWSMIFRLGALGLLAACAQPPDCVETGDLRVLLAFDEGPSPTWQSHAGAQEQPEAVLTPDKGSVNQVVVSHDRMRPASLGAGQRHAFEFSVGLETETDWVIEVGRFWDDPGGPACYYYRELPLLESCVENSVVVDFRHITACYE